MSEEHAISPLVRPVMLGTVGFMTFGVALVSGTAESFFPGHGARFGAAVMGTLSQVPGSIWELFNVLGLGYIGGKTVERAATSYLKAQSARPDNPDGGL